MLNITRFKSNIVEAAVVPAGARVLIVEDQELIQEMLLTVFRHAGFQTIVAGTVGEALGKLNPPPDFCTLDLHLPDGCGTQVLRRIRQHRLPTKVAVTTGAIDPAILAEAERWQPERIFQKPYSALDLVAWISSFASRPRLDRVAELSAG